MAATSGVSVDWFDPQAVTEYLTAWAASPEGGVRIGLNILKFVVILFVAWIAAKIVAGMVGAAVRRLPKTSSLLQSFAVNLTRRTVLIVGFVVALGALGFNITPLVAAIGAAGLVIGLALQGTLSNFASGILILIYRPFDVGDGINAGGVSGKVEAMSLVQTTVLTFDNQIQLVPNNEIWNSVITNITGLDTRRVDLTFGIGYADDMAKAESIIREVIASHDKVLAEPAPVVKVSELADNSVNFIARPWSKTSDYWDVYWDVTRAIKERFDAEGVGIPYPQRDIHVPEALRVVVTNE
jgi:small conductance mechanosensitive channel